MSQSGVATPSPAPPLRHAPPVPEGRRCVGKWGALLGRHSRRLESENQHTSYDQGHGQAAAPAQALAEKHHREPDGDDHAQFVDVRGFPFSLVCFPKKISAAARAGKRVKE